MPASISMLEEHKSIVAALHVLSVAAKEANKVEYVEFAKALILHAQTEEEVSTLPRYSSGST